MTGKITYFLLLSLFLTSIYGVDPYYPTNYKKHFENNDLSSEKLKLKLFDLLDKAHLINEGGDDKLIDSCSGMGRDCYRHQRISYKQARRYLFGKLHLKNDYGQYYVKDVYCEKIFDDTIVSLGTDELPDERIVNVEHTWPRKRFTKKLPQIYQTSDLHHLYPTDSKANSTRSNRYFGEVSNGVEATTDCYSSKYGKSTDLFEPPASHKGNVARAMFYFSVRYGGSIDTREEMVLRSWHEQDPVDEEERIRNHQIFKIQGTRNPFIDYPELVHRIFDY